MQNLFLYEESLIKFSGKSEKVLKYRGKFIFNITQKLIKKSQKFQ